MSALALPHQIFPEVGQQSGGDTRPQGRREANLKGSEADHVRALRHDAPMLSAVWARSCMHELWT